MIKVIAVARGYYGEKIREPGEVFGIEKKEDFSELWMANPDGEQKRRDQVKRAADTSGADGGKGTDGVVTHSNPTVPGEDLAHIEPSQEQLDAAKAAEAERAQKAAEKPKSREPKPRAAPAKGKASGK